jgi:hypothetical protein
VTRLSRTTAVKPENDAVQWLKRLQAALPINQMQLNKLPNKSIKYAKILFQIKQMQNSEFETTFDTFDKG